MLVLKAAVIGGTGLAILLAVPVVAETQDRDTNQDSAQRGAFELAQGAPGCHPGEVMNMALNNAENLVKSQATTRPLTRNARQCSLVARLTVRKSARK
jgi:hypothetical protein